MLLRKIKLIIAFIFFKLILVAQLIDSDVWLFKIEKNKNIQTLTNPLNITNRKGYDNQPSFSNDDKKIFYVSIREDKQADIYYYDLKRKKNIQFTKTLESEYSPSESQHENEISSVIVEKDSSQRIHFLNLLTGSDENKFEFDSVGYYTFLNKDTVVYYKLTEPHSLRYFIKKTKEDKWLGDYPIRTFKAINRHTLIYGLKDSLKVIFYTYNFLLHKAKKYAQFNTKNEDITWQAPYGLIKSEAAILFRFDELKQDWVIFFDLSEFGIKKITRFTFDSKNKYLVIVNNL